MIKVETAPEFNGSDEEWENICVQCGKCCLKCTNMRIVDENDDVLYRFTARNLNNSCEKLENNRCSEYDDRYTKGNKCHSITKAIREGFLPFGCAYEEFSARDRENPYFEFDGDADLVKQLSESKDIKRMSGGLSQNTENVKCTKSRWI